MSQKRIEQQTIQSCRLLDETWLSTRQKRLVQLIKSKSVLNFKVDLGKDVFTTSLTQVGISHITIELKIEAKDIIQMCLKLNSAY